MLKLKHEDQETHPNGGAESGDTMSLAQQNVDSLVALAERERTGEAIEGRQIEKVLVSVCKKNVTKLMLSRKLAPIDVELILIIEHWLEVYGIELELTIKSKTALIDGFAPISLGALGIASTLLFLTESETFKSLSGDQAVLFLLSVFAILTILRILVRASMKKSWTKREFSTKLLAMIKENTLEMKKG